MTFEQKLKSNKIYRVVTPGGYVFYRHEFEDKMRQLFGINWQKLEIKGFEFELY